MRKGNICEDANAEGNSSDRLGIQFFLFSFFFFINTRIASLVVIAICLVQRSGLSPYLEIFFVYLVRANAGNETRTKYTNNRSYNRSIESLCNYTYVIKNERERERERTYVCVCLYVREKECAHLFRLHCITIISLA